MARRRALVAPSPDLLPSPDLQTIDLSDPPVREWKDALTVFGSPYSDNLPAEATSEQAIPSVAFPKLQTEARQRHTTLATEECLVLLRRRDFDPMKFIHAIFGNSPIGQYELASQNLGGSGSNADESKLSFLQSVAENMHNYVRAQNDLLATRDQFAAGVFPGQRDVKRLYDDVKKIRDTMSEFFKDISAQAKQAQNASALLSRISTYSFIFQLSSQIDNFGSRGQFEEIARIVQKTRQFAFLENIPLFASALKQIDISLRNVEVNLKTKLRGTTVHNFNKLHCMLLMDIQHGGNPVLELLQSTVDRVRLSFDSGSLSSQTQAFEEAVPFWGTLCGFLREHSPQKFDSVSGEINQMFLDLVRDYNIQNRRLLNQISAQIPAGETFHKELHTNFRRSYAVWALPMPNPGVVQITSQIRTDLQVWYVDHIKECCRVILGVRDPGVKLTAFLLEFLDVADLFAPEVYRELVLSPIYGIFDAFHEKAVNSDQTDLVTAINAVSNLTTTNLDLLIDRCNSVLKMQLIDTENDDLIGVGVQLRSMMKEKLLRELTRELDAAIYQGFFGGSTEWLTVEMPIDVDGYTVLIINRCIDCKCTWGVLYDELRVQIVEHVIASILRAVSNCGALKAAAVGRIEVNLAILKRAFGQETKSLWDVIENALDIRRTGPAVKPAEIIARIENSMRLQLIALE